MEDILFLAMIGLVLSIYSFYVAKKSEKNKSYRAVCDINAHISCTRAFTSKYGRTLGIHNSVVGIIFYVVILILSIAHQNVYVFYMSILGVVSSIYLAFISYVRMKNFCVVCSAIYLINILLFIASIQ